MKMRLCLLSLIVLSWNFTAHTLQADEPVVGKLPDATKPTLSLFQAVILGFVEGATEYLPVSSTGHLLIVEHLLEMDGDVRKVEAAHSLAICIQIGAILAVVVLYTGRIRQILTGILGRDSEGLRLFVNLVIAFLPAAVIGLLFNTWIKDALISKVGIVRARNLGFVLARRSARRCTAVPCILAGFQPQSRNNSGMSLRRTSHDGSRRIQLSPRPCHTVCRHRLRRDEKWPSND